MTIQDIWYQQQRRQSLLRAYAAGMAKKEPVLIDDPLCFTALEDSSIDMIGLKATATTLEEILQKPQSHIKLEYKLNDDGEWTAVDWTSWNLDSAKIASTSYIHTTTEISIPKNSKLYLRCAAEGNAYISNQFEFVNVFCMNGSMNVSGNINSLLSRYEIDNIPDFCFDCLFAGLNYQSLKLNKNTLKSAADLKLPAKKIGNNAYYGMFNSQNLLTESPEELPAAEIGKQCYAAMFQYCSSLISAPVISAKNLSENCFSEMYYNCSSLKISENGSSGTKILEIPSGTTESELWNNLMFSGTAGSFSGNPSVGNAYYCY